MEVASPPPLRAKPQGQEVFRGHQRPADHCAIKDVAPDCRKQQPPLEHSRLGPSRQDFKYPMGQNHEVLASLLTYQIWPDYGGDCLRLQWSKPIRTLVHPPGLP